VPGPRRLGLFGGTFDPVHIGHLTAAEAVRQALRLDAIWFLPAALPPHKLEYPISSFADRLAMLELAIGGRPACAVSALEAELPKPSYTIDTLRELRRQLGPLVELFFIMGLDAFAEIDTWKAYNKLLSLASFAVLARPSHPLATAEAIIKRCFVDFCHDPVAQVWIAQERPGAIHVLNMEPVPVSSTAIRQVVRNSGSIEPLVPAAVAAYIRDHRLYLA